MTREVGDAPTACALPGARLSWAGMEASAGSWGALSMELSMPCSCGVLGFGVLISQGSSWQWLSKMELQGRRLAESSLVA